MSNCRCRLPTDRSARGLAKGLQLCDPFYFTFLAHLQAP